MLGVEPVGIGFQPLHSYSSGILVITITLHFMVVKGLERYGYHQDARRIAMKWLKTNNHPGSTPSMSSIRMPVSRKNHHLKAWHLSPTGSAGPTLSLKVVIDCPALGPQNYRGSTYLLNGGNLSTGNVLAEIPAI